MRHQLTLAGGPKADIVRAGGDSAEFDVAGPNFQELMALIGHLLLRSGWLEDGLKGDSIPDELQRVRLIRNAICHRLISAHAYVEGETAAHVCCRLTDGTVIRYSAAGLEEAIQELEGMRRRYSKH